MRPCLPVLCFVFLAACSHAPSVPLPLAPRDFEESPYAADIRSRIVGHNGEVYACYQKSAAAHALQAPDASSSLRYDRERNRYVFSGSPKEPSPKTPPLTPFASAFEECLGPGASSWILFRPIDGFDVTARFFFLPPGAPHPTAPDTEDAASGNGALRGVDPAWSSPLFDVEGVRGFVDVAEMTRPRQLGGTRIAYTREALANRVEGTLRVRCRITTGGVLRACTVLQPLPLMDQPVLDALATNRYTPVLYRGKPVEVDYTFTIVLRIPKD